MRFVDDLVFVYIIAALFSCLLMLNVLKNERDGVDEIESVRV